MLFEWVQLIFFAAVFICLTPILGAYIANLFTGKASYAHRIGGWLEDCCYRVGGVDPIEEMSWTRYGKALFLFNFYGFITLFLLQLVQGILPLNPQNFDGVPWPLAFNTAMSFTTNTNWQSYAGETTLSYLTQMLGLTSHNFLSAATGMSVLMALIRGLTRKESETIGNFWVDLVRMVVYILLPLSILLALLLAAEGVVQTLSPYIEAATLEDGMQTIPLGQAASQVAIKQLGTNGGGFFLQIALIPLKTPQLFLTF